MIADIGAFHHAFKAIKAAYTALNAFFIAVFHLICPMRICDMRPAECGKILNTLLKLLFCLLGRSDKICGDYRNINNLFNLCRQIFAPTAFKGGGFKPIIKSIVRSRGNINCVYAFVVQHFSHFYAIGKVVTHTGFSDFCIHFINC